MSVLRSIIFIFLLFIAPFLGKTAQDVSSFSKLKNEPASSPRNIILLIGDGMGLAHIATAYYMLGENFHLSSFPVVGLQKTHAHNLLITDSAAAGTAMACGIKTYNSAVGVDADTLEVANFFELAKEHDYATGIIVTSSLVHATPASFVAHEPLRGLYENIAIDFLNSRLDLMVGGGLSYFTNRSLDDRNLAHELELHGYHVGSYMGKSLQRINPESVKKIAYFTAYKEPLPRMQGRDYLPVAVEYATHFLDSKTETGFILVIEGSQIDYASHSNNLDYLVSELADFNRAIGKALDFARIDGETLIIVTSDHETGDLKINPGRNLKYPKVKFESKRHSADMIPVFAYGPGSEEFNGIYDNTEIFYKIIALANLD
jgi:alkaline phosphatase